MPAATKTRKYRYSGKTGTIKHLGRKGHYWVGDDGRERLPVSVTEAGVFVISGFMVHPGNPLERVA